MTFKQAFIETGNMEYLRSYMEEFQPDAILWEDDTPVFENAVQDYSIFGPSMGMPSSPTRHRIDCPAQFAIGMCDFCGDYGLLPTIPEPVVWLPVNPFVNPDPPMGWIVYQDHVHTSDGKCIKNRYGPKCE